MIPIMPESRIMMIGCAFFKANTNIAKKISAGMIKDGVKKEDTVMPFGNRTVFPVETTAAAISPITAGFNPAMQPFITPLS